MLLDPQTKVVVCFSYSCCVCICNALFDKCVILHFYDARGGWIGLPAAAEAGGVSFDSRSRILSVGQVKMRVKEGDITKEKADAVINSTNERIDMTGGMYSLSCVMYSLSCVSC